MADAESILAEYGRKLANARQEYWNVHRRMQDARNAMEIAKAAYDAAKAVLDVSEQKANKPAQQKRQRSLTENWQRIMRLMDETGNITFGYEHLEAAAEQLGLAISKETLRSQMSNYKATGLVQAVGPGEFLLTQEGRKAAKIDGKKVTAPDAATSGAGSVFGREAELEGTPAAQHPAANRESVGSNPTASAPVQTFRETFSDDLDDDIPF